MKKGRVSFVDILGESGRKYDKWWAKEMEIYNYYLTYKFNYYDDKFDFAILRDGCCSEPYLLTNDINEITAYIDKYIVEENAKIKGGNERI